jgi:hypothetical protein
MSHEIMKTEDGTFAMAYREGDALPWHAAETNPQTFARFPTPEEVSDAARLGYEVQLVPNCRPDGSPIADSFHISRVDDPATVFGRFVAGDWQPVQNSSLLELAAHICERHDFEVITAGALFGGSKVFVQMETGREFSLPGNDKLVSRLLATVSHTGLESNKFVGCNTRVVCNNTVRAATGEGAGIVCHDHRVEFDHDAITAAVGLNAESFGEFADVRRRRRRPRTIGRRGAWNISSSFTVEKKRSKTTGASVIPSESVRQWPRIAGKCSCPSARRTRRTRRVCRGPAGPDSARSRRRTPGGRDGGPVGGD